MKGQYLTIEEVSKSISAGGTPRRNNREYWDKGTIKWLKISDLKNKYVTESEEKISEKGLQESSAKLFPAGTILYSIFATLGEVAILKVESATNQAIAGIIPDTDKIDTEYLYYCLKAEKSNIIKKKSHATQDNINLTILRNHRIIVPSLLIQKQIVAILEHAERLKELRQKANEETGSIVQSIFYEMFGDPFLNTKNLKFDKLGNVANIIMGQSPNGKSYNYDGKGMPLLNGPTEFGLVHPSEKQWTSKPTKLAKKGGILFCVRGATAGRLNWADKEYCIGRGLAAISSKSDISNEFIFTFLKINYDYFQAIGQGSTFINIGKKMLSEMSIPLPSIELAQLFMRASQRIELVNYQQRQSQMEINSLFDSLMQKAFSGELVG